MIKQVDSMGHCHGPQGGISHIGPVDRCMEHHSSRDAHDTLYGMLGSAVVVVGTCTSKTNYLCEGTELLSESGGCEGRSIVSVVVLWNHTMVTAH
jgi:hypothetical protein